MSKTLRQKLNDGVRSAGNTIYDNGYFGLGDVLTTEITPRNAFMLGSALSLGLAQPAYATNYPTDLSTNNDTETSKKYSGEVKIEKIQMPDGTYYEIYKSSGSVGGFKILPAQSGERIRVGLEGDIHKVTGDFYELTDEDGPGEDRVCYVRDTEAKGMNRIANNMLKTDIQGNEKVKAKLKRTDEGYVVVVNGTRYKRFNSRTINGKEYLVMPDVRSGGSDRLKWIFTPLDGTLELELVGNGGICFVSQTGNYVATRMKGDKKPKESPKKGNEGVEKFQID